MISILKFTKIEKRKENVSYPIVQFNHEKLIVKRIREYLLFLTFVNSVLFNLNSLKNRPFED